MKHEDKSREQLLIEIADELGLEPGEDYADTNGDSHDKVYQSGLARILTAIKGGHRAYTKDDLRRGLERIESEAEQKEANYASGMRYATARLTEVLEEE